MKNGKEFIAVQDVMHPYFGQKINTTLAVGGLLSTDRFQRRLSSTP
jgi:hypothetical protein